MKISEVKVTSVKSSFGLWPGPHKWFTLKPLDLYDKYRVDYVKNSSPTEDCLIEIVTDEGIRGISKTTEPQGFIIENFLKPMILGENPLNIEMLWDQMYRATMPFGRKGTVIMAIGAVDTALWDIIGKARKEPVYNLLGGKTREKIRAYASHLHPAPAKELAKEAMEYLEEGYTAMKQRLVSGPSDGVSGMKRNVELVEAVRDAVGYNVDLMADCWMGWNVQYTIKMAKKLRRFELTWLEEPIIPDNVDGYAKIRKAVETPIAAGEHEYTLWGFKELLQKEAVDIIQPDIIWAGGITVCRKICALAEAYSIPVIPHTSTAPTLHLIMANTVNVCPLAEFLTKYPMQTYFKESIIPESGYFTVSERPGLGVEFKPFIY